MGDGSGGECDLVSEVCGEAASLDKLLCLGDLRDACLVLQAEVMSGVDELWVWVWWCVGGVRAGAPPYMAPVVG